MKKITLLILFLYLFMVMLRIAGQLFNGTPIDWKATLTLGELDNTQDYGDRWKLRIAVLIAFPFIWIYSGVEKLINKYL
jgi:hypothetical protein